MTPSTNVSIATTLTDLESRANNILSQNFANDRTGLFYKVYTIGKSDKTPHEADGVYLLIGTDSETVKGVATDASTVLEEYRKQSYNLSWVYPNCTVVKFDNKISSHSDLIDLRDRLDFTKLIFKKFNMDPPEQYTMRDFLTLFEIYDMWDKCEDANLKEDLNRQLEHTAKIINSGMKWEEYEKINGTVSVGDEKMHKAFTKKAQEALVPSIYTSDKPNCIEMPLMLKHGGEIVAFNVKEEYLAGIEEDLQLFPEMNYSIVKESVPTYSDVGLQHWHMLAFPANYKSVVCPIVHKHELGLEDRARAYSPDDLEIAYSIPISASDFEQFVKYFKEVNLDFYLDMNGTYQRSDVNSVGIVVEDADSFQKMKNVVILLLTDKMKNTIISEEDEKEKCKELKNATKEELINSKNKGDFVITQEIQELITSRARGITSSDMEK